MKTREKYISFIKAVRNNSLPDCKQFIKQNLDVNHRLDNLMSPFEASFEKASPELVQLLISAKANVNSLNRHGAPLHIILRNNNNTNLDLLLEAKADVNIEHKGETPLLIATQSGKVEIVEKLLIHGANLNKLYPPKNLTILHIACVMEPLNFLIVKAIIDKAPSLLTTEASQLQITPLIMTIERQHLGLTKYLIFRKAHVNQINKKDINPLTTALDYKNTEILQYLLEKKADVNQKFRVNGTILHLALNSQPKNVKVIKLLLDAKADLDIANKDSLTPLNLALRNNNKEILDLIDPSITPKSIVLSVENSKFYFDIEKTLKNFIQEAEKLMPRVHQLPEDKQIKIYQEAKNIRNGLGQLMQDEILSKTDLGIVKKNLTDMKQAPAEKLSDLEQRIFKLKKRTLAQIAQLSAEKSQQAFDSDWLKKETETLMSQYVKNSKQLLALQKEFKNIELPVHFAQEKESISQLERQILRNYALLQELNDSNHSAPDRSHIDTIFKEFKDHLNNYQQKSMLFATHVERINKKSDKEVPWEKPEQKIKEKKSYIHSSTKIRRDKVFSELKTSKAKTFHSPVSKKFNENQLMSVSSRTQNSYKLQKNNIRKNILAAKFLLEKLNSSIILLDMLCFSELNRLKYCLMQILLNIVINQSQITRRPELRNMRNTLHSMSLIYGGADPSLGGVCQLQQEIHELAEALTELIHLYRKDEFSAEYYLPRYAPLNFISPLLTKMSSPRFDTRNISDEKFQFVLRKSAEFNQFCWMQLTHILLQPKPISPQFISTDDAKLTVSFAILCQISEAQAAGQTTIHIRNRDFHLDSTLKGIACEWRHRGLSLQKASHRLEQQLNCLNP